MAEIKQGFFYFNKQKFILALILFILFILIYLSGMLIKIGPGSVGSGKGTAQEIRVVLFIIFALPVYLLSLVTGPVEGILIVFLFLLIEIAYVYLVSCTVYWIFWKIKNNKNKK
jgi:hypothetical protein